MLNFEKGLTDCICETMAIFNDPETVQKGKFLLIIVLFCKKNTMLVEKYIKECVQDTSHLSETIPTTTNWGNTLHTTVQTNM